MAGFRTFALGAALVAATAGASNAQIMPGGTHPDSPKAGDWRRGMEGRRRGEMGPGDRRGMEHGRRERRGPHGKMGHGMEFLRSLNLTETQRGQVRAIHEKYAPQMKAIHERARSEFESTREARQRGDTAAVKSALQKSRQNMGQQAAALHEQAMREILAILTPEQRAKANAKITEQIQRLDDQKSRLERLRR